MKLDMHCHVREGSVDSRVSLDEYITTLKEKGFDGMLITDHDTYHGYRHWKYHMKGKVHEDFVVLKGIYDSAIVSLETSAIKLVCVSQTILIYYYKLSIDIINISDKVLVFIYVYRR